MGAGMLEDSVLLLLIGFVLAPALASHSIGQSPPRREPLERLRSGDLHLRGHQGADKGVGNSVLTLVSHPASQRVRCVAIVFCVFGLVRRRLRHIREARCVGHHLHILHALDDLVGRLFTGRDMLVI